MWRRGVRGLIRGSAWAALVIALAVATRAAGGVRSANPWWFEDGYTSLEFVDAAGTTAHVRVAGTGTVSLPMLPAGVAFDPAASIVLVASAAGVRAWAFDGVRMVRAPRFDIGGQGYTGVAWIGRVGNLVAAATSGAVILLGWNGSGWTEVASLATPVTCGVAEGAPVVGDAGTLLVGTGTGFDVVGYRAGTLAVDPGAGVTDLQGVDGIAAAPGGALVAVWHGGDVSVYGWDGRAYRETPTWEIPAASQPVEAVAWLRDGDGYWVLTSDGSLTAYGFDGSYVRRLDSLSTTLTQPVAALGTGWRQGDIAALGPGGLDYEDGTPLSSDPSRSVTNLSLPLYASSARLLSTVLTVGHDLSEIQIDTAVVDLPPGTGVAYDVSTDGGRTWTSVPPCLNAADPLRDCAADNTALPPGADLQYRMTLSTANPSVTPVVDGTELLEVATEVEAESGAPAILIR